MQETKYLSVSALNSYIEYKLNNDAHLRRIFIKGEISNIRLSGGHYYFSLKDEESEVSCIMFQNYHRSLQFKLKEGMKVLIEGKLSVYHRRGTYSLQVFQIEEDGLGQLYLQFLHLKERLEKEGLFDVKYKKPIPEYSQRIGVITSGTGDALHDIVQTINKRFALAQIYLYPSLVQGVDAPKDLIRNVRRAVLDNIVDVIIIGRGGGSFEDLAAFNDELLAREIFNSSIPIVSAVGHEADFTICDFVADFRAPTPTAAAVAVTKDKQEIILNLHQKTNQINRAIINILNRKHNELIMLINSYALKNFSEIINRKNQQFLQSFEKLTIYSPINIIKRNLTDVNNLSIRLKNINLIKQINQYDQIITSNNKILNKYIIDKINHYYANLDKSIEKMIILNPLNVIKKGYTIAYQENKIMRSIDELDNKKTLNIQFSDGLVKTKILNKSKEKINE